MVVAFVAFAARIDELVDEEDGVGHPVMLVRRSALAGAP